jgi:cell division protein YceG involved in septum cleavage
LVVVCVVVGACAWGAYAVIRDHRDASPPPPTTTVPARKVLSVLFPEGFTRQEMARRAQAASPAIGATAYLRATRSSALPGTFAGDGKRRSLEGFLFPATYDLYDDDSAQVLVGKQLAAFSRNWRQVGLGYARSKNLTPSRRRSSSRASARWSPQ